MPAVARLESTLAFNDVEFTNGIARAEKRAQTFAGRVEGSFQGLFKRTPGRRAERAIGNLLGDISTGNAAQGIAQFAGRLTGLGLAAGVGIGVAVELFDKLHESVVEVRKAHDELDRQMSHPLNLTSIEGLGKAIDTLREKQGTFTHGLTNYLTEFVKASTGLGPGELGTTQLKEQKEINAAIEKRQDAERSQGREELVRARTLAGLENDPKRRALAEARFKFEDQEKAIRSSPGKGSELKLEALELERQKLEENFKLGKSMRSDEFEDVKKLLTLKRMALSPEQEKLATAGLSLESVNRKLTNKSLSPEERNVLLGQKFSAETDIQALTPKKPRNPFAFGTTAARNFEDDQGGFGTLAGRNRDTNDPNVFGSLANSAMNRGESPLTAGQTGWQEVAGLLKNILELEQKVWATP
jgi:hypothetical protein